MIAIKSNKKLFFPSSYKGYVTMEIVLIQNNPINKVYDLKIVDTAFDDDKTITETHVDPVTQQDVTTTRNVKVPLGQPVVRMKTMTYDDLDNLAATLNVDMTDATQLRENINELFRQGLLLITQMECMNNEGMYFSEAQDWSIVRPDVNTNPGD